MQIDQEEEAEGKVMPVSSFWDSEKREQGEKEKDSGDEHLFLLLM